eukprot:5684997-Pyramimonas_sp.AAC.1
MTWGTTWDNDRNCHIERKAWAGWAPAEPADVDGARLLAGLAIPEDCFHAPTSYPLAGDPVDYN